MNHHRDGYDTEVLWSSGKAHRKSAKACQAQFHTAHVVEGHKNTACRRAETHVNACHIAKVRENGGGLRKCGGVLILWELDAERAGHGCFALIGHWWRHCSLQLRNMVVGCKDRKSVV